MDRRISSLVRLYLLILLLRLLRAVVDGPILVFVLLHWASCHTPVPAASGPLSVASTQAPNRVWPRGTLHAWAGQVKTRNDMV